MPLIIKEEQVSKEYFDIPPDASRFYIMIPKTYLSEAYYLTFGDKISAEILEVKTNEEKFEELEERK